MKTLKEKIEVMQAALSGKKIEYNIYNGAQETPKWEAYVNNTPIWAWDRTDYRIKPVPLEFWVNVYKENIYIHDSEKKAKS